LATRATAFLPAKPRTWVRHVKAYLGLMLLLLVAPSSAAAAPMARQQPHPAVVRVSVADGGGSYSMGSGTLVAVQGSRGLVVTNWHVVRDAVAPPEVIFPDGFRSAAVVARLDSAWDLAALVIWRPRARPVAISPHPPRPGEPLTIAGYGSGNYRMATGRCTQYLSPGGQHGFELVELSTPARQGDSGGPIFNSRGELAGVLFGSSMGTTSGSFCGRVDRFLSPVIARLEQLEPTTPELQGEPGMQGQPEMQVEQEQMIAARPAQSSGPVASIRAPATHAGNSSGGNSAPEVIPRWESVSPAEPSIGRPPALPALPASPAAPSADGGWHAASPLAPEAGQTPALSGADADGATQPSSPNSQLMDQIKTVLAGIGVLAIFAQIIRLLGRAG
jgi:hypothetical protein